MRQRFPAAPEKLNERQDAAALKAVREGAVYGMTLAKKLALEQCNEFAAGLQQDIAHLKKRR